MQSGVDNADSVRYMQPVLCVHVAVARMAEARRVRPAYALRAHEPRADKADSARCM